jgi:hypothetical protein
LNAAFFQADSANDSAHVTKIDIRILLGEIGRGLCHRIQRERNPQGRTRPDALAIGNIGNIWCNTVLAAMFLP